MSKRVTIRDVAADAGVSVGTVSRVLNGQPHVSPAARERVLKSVARLRFQPSAMAQSMRTRHSECVGFLVYDIANPLFARIVRSAGALLQEAGFGCLLASSDGKAAREAEALQLMQRRGVDGMIMAVVDQHSEDLRRMLRGLEAPVVLLDREVDGAECDMVLSDHAGGVAAATRYLLERGHRRIGLITAPKSIRPGAERVRGFVEAFAAGVSLDPDLVRAGGLTADFGYLQAMSLLGLPTRPTAIVAGGTQVLAGVLRALGALRLRVPRDLSLIACDDSDLTALNAPPITVVARDLEEMGRVAASLLLDHLQGDGARERRRILLPTELVLRQSCAAPPS